MAEVLYDIKHPDFTLKITHREDGEYWMESTCSGKFNGSCKTIIKRNGFCVVSWDSPELRRGEKIVFIAGVNRSNSFTKLSLINYFKPFLDWLQSEFGEQIKPLKLRIKQL